MSECILRQLGAEPSPGPPFDRARGLYKCTRDFLADCVAHERAGGVIINTPELFVMGRPVCMEAPDADIINLHVGFLPGVCNAWFVWCCVGSAKQVLAAMPYTLPFIGFARADVRRWYSTEKLQRRFGLVKQADCG